MDTKNTSITKVYFIPNRAYDVMKWLAALFLPALAVFITTIGAAVGWHDAPIVATIVTASAAFLGTLCGVSTLTAKDGE
ncbi:MAG: phage holin [Atopobiaceae bacterium]|jgi:uncharacterized membrane protein YqaE (UPF0057 family)|nr:phage holin [Atopobiaceae bacterium]